MKKAIVFLLFIALLCLALASCEKEVVTYCPFCSKTGIKEVSVYDRNTGITTIYYQCTNEKCGKTFGAAKL